MDEAFLELLEKKEFEYITVKEICEKAGVNRSTFYLHYETVADLLSECAEYINNKCFCRYSREHSAVIDQIATADLERLIFITPDYLRPYFEFVRENKRLLQAMLSRPFVLNADATFANMFKNIFSPVMDRFRCAEENKHYVISFYIAGLIAIVSEWIKGDCADSIDEIINICMNCVMPNGKEAHLIHFTEKNDK